MATVLVDASVSEAIPVSLVVDRQRVLVRIAEDQLRYTLISL
jgi:hypothetical protein